MDIMEQEKSKIEKLPLWAKQLISGLKNKIRTQKEGLSRLGGSPTGISYGNKFLDEVVHYIPEDAVITFKVGTNNRDEIRVDLNTSTFKKPCLHVSGSDRIRIYPGASHAVRIDLED